MKEHNVIGTMQLLAACQKAPGVERLVVQSSTAVYGTSSRDPAMFTEDMAAKRMPKVGFAKDVLEVEGYVRGFSRRRPDVAVTLLRAADTLGPRVDSPLAQYFRLPVIPTLLGFDARLQFLHETDLLEVLRHATVAGPHGTFNVAGEGVLMLSQAVRRLGRPTVPMPGVALRSAGAALRQVGMPASLAPDVTGFLTFGRGVDTSRMRQVLRFEPDYTTEATFDDFGRQINPGMSVVRTSRPTAVPHTALRGGAHA
jgi:UDP-glucose 4-epimerase